MDMDRYEVSDPSSFGSRKRIKYRTDVWHRVPVPAVGDLLAATKFLELSLARLLNGVAALACKLLILLRTKTGIDNADLSVKNYSPFDE